MMPRRPARRRTWCAVALAVFASGVAGRAARADEPKPPAGLISGEPAYGRAVDPVFAYFKLDRLRCRFSEDKHVALLARPLHSTGTIYFDRTRGIARTTLTPRRQDAILTAASLRLRTGDHTEEIPLDKTRDLRAFALIFPTLLRGDRFELERSFELGLYGSERDWWALALTPKAESLRALVRRVVVIGHKAELVSLQIAEASGDTTETQLTAVTRNADVPDAEIAIAFGAR
jgi:hypothetical protein